MPFSVQELERDLKSYLDQVQGEEIVILLSNGEMVRLSRITADDLVDEAIEADPRFVRLIAERRQQYRSEGGVPQSKVKQVLIEELKQDRIAEDEQVRQEAARLMAELSNPK